MDLFDTYGFYKWSLVPPYIGADCVYWRFYCGKATSKYMYQSAADAANLVVAIKQNIVYQEVS